MKDGKTRLWRSPKVYRVMVIALSAGCLGGLALTVVIALLIA